MPVTRGMRTLGEVTAPAAGTMARREAVAQWPAGDEVDDTSNRGPRGGGGGAYRATTWCEVEVEAAHWQKSGGGRGPLVLRASQ
jgi:hypothetical protein